MIVRDVAEFGSTLPNDRIEDEDEIVQFGGRSVALAVAEHLRTLGCNVPHLIYMDFKGWELEVEAKRRSFGVRISELEDDEYVMALWDRGFWSSLLNRPHPAYRDILRRLNEALRSDPRFVNLRWFARPDVHSGKPGADTPVD